MENGRERERRREREREREKESKVEREREGERGSFFFWKQFLTVKKLFFFGLLRGSFSFFWSRRGERAGGGDETGASQRERQQRQKRGSAGLRET